MKRILTVKAAFAAAVCAAIVMPLLSGCNSTPARKSDPAPEMVYIPKEYQQLMKKIDYSGVQKAWIKPDEIKNYSKITVAVITSPKQLASTDWQSFNSRYLVSSYNDDMQYVAKYTSNSFLDAFKKSKTLRLTATPGNSTMVLEFAIVQIVPNKPVIGAVTNLTSLTPIGILLLPAKLTLKGDSDNTGGSIAMEAVLRDSRTGAVLAVFADRQKGKTAIFSAKEFTAYANVREIIDRWTANTVTALDQIREGKKIHIKDETGFVAFDF